MVHFALYDSDPFLAFKTTEYAQRLKEDFGKSQVFQNLITKYLIGNKGNQYIKKFNNKID